MSPTRLTFIAAPLVAIVALAGCALGDEPAVGAAAGHVTMTDAHAATLRICHAALALEHNTFVEFDWNTAYESAANMDLDVGLVQDEDVRAAAQLAIDTVPDLLEDESLSDDAFIEAIVPVMSGFYSACDEWAADHLYDE
ncbi:hypothetical protein [uncultured Cellulomonas sp.]|uniref:hypothetical protein n=1 Tax=uncultured Cellulomonas sp. TaxID=189682 RepID=UPI00261ED798|nr:hypothetical protein [uncultured Cellulomonas sp.]